MTISKKLRGMKLPPGYNACLLLDAANEIDRLARERDEARAERDALRADAERFASFAFPPFCDEYAGVDLYDQASIYASAFGREEPNRDDYVAALRDAVDAAMAQAKDAEAR
ncbi:MAG: hypothetical protein WDA07_06355 [Leucobacter sp.]